MNAPVNVPAVMDAAPRVAVNGVTVLHNSKEWRVATNRHPTTWGASWGWIDGAPGNVCWSDDEDFDRKAAGLMTGEELRACERVIAKATGEKA